MLIYLNRNERIFRDCCENIFYTQLNNINSLPKHKRKYPFYYALVLNLVSWFTYGFVIILMVYLKTEKEIKSQISYAFFYIFY